MNKKIKVGLVGCGVISDIYIENSKKFLSYEIIACADIIRSKAEEKAKKYNIQKVCTVDELMQDKEIEVVLNLTIPQAHAEISLKALNAKKHVYCEKPLAVNLSDGKKIVDLAKKNNLRVGCAPDTFLGGRNQMCKKIIDEGWLGKIIGGSVSMLCPGHEIWHPGPAFYYKEGAGPLFDMAPYYITALISLMGPVLSLSGSVSKTYEKRVIKSEPLRGTEMEVEVPTHIAAILNFKNGAIINCTFSFDVWDTKSPRMEIYGSEGTLCIDDADPYDGPNSFGGPIKFRTKYESDWLDFPSIIPRKPQATEWPRIPTLFSYNGNSRGIGLADMASSIMNNSNHRANGDMAYHALEIMQGIFESAQTGKDYFIKSTFDVPKALNPKLPEFVTE